MPRSATDVAREVVDEGVGCDVAVEELVRRIEAEGLRFCPLAVELVLGGCGLAEEAGREEGDDVVPATEECEALANALAEMNERDEIDLSVEGVRLVGAVLTGGAWEREANSSAERDQRGEISLSEEELSLVRCILGEEEEDACDAIANSLAERADRGEIILSSDVVSLIRVMNEGGDAEASANSLAERDQRGEISLSDEELSLVRCILGGVEAPAVVAGAPVVADRPGVWTMGVPSLFPTPPGTVYLANGTFREVYEAIQTWLPFIGDAFVVMSLVGGTDTITWTKDGVTGL